MNASAVTCRESLLARRHRYLGPAYRLFYEQPLHIVRGEDVWLVDADGRRYLDLYNNVPHVGHCHPKVVAAIREQVGVLNTHTRYLHDTVVDYAERLLDKLPDKLAVAMFCCSGSEANELALRVARAATGGTGIIVLEDAYHGTTQATFEISTEDNPRELWPDHVVTVPAPNPYRGACGDDGPAYAEHLTRAIDTLAQRGIRPAAFVVDTIASSSGVIAPPRGYLERAADIVRAAGGLFVADEVQSGFGRTGRHFWGFEADGIVPDIVTLGKPMGNGHPLAATVLRAPLAERFAERFGYFNTFGGNPVSAAAGMAVLEVIEQEALQDNALEVGRYLTDGLHAMAERQPLLGDVRGRGLFIGVELVADCDDAGHGVSDSKRPATKRAARLVNALKARGVLTNVIGPDANVLKLRPPMTFSKAHADFFLQQFDAALAELGEPLRGES